MGENNCQPWRQETRPTSLQENLDDLAEMIGKFGMAVAGLVFVVLFL